MQEGNKMKKKTGKWIRQVRLAGILFIIGVLTLAIYGSFAAYTSFNSVKRVVSTGTQSDTMFSSNYLSQMNLDDQNYPVKRISLAEKDGACTFTVQICNYVWGDEALYNPKDITYNLTAQLIAAAGGDLPDGLEKISIQGKEFGKDGSCRLDSQTLKSGSANKLEYAVVFPSALKDKVKIEIKAEPDDNSKEAVNSQKLAAVLSFADYKAVKGWTGHFLDSRQKTPDKYDAFNYEISGNGAGTVSRDVAGGSADECVGCRREEGEQSLQLYCGQLGGDGGTVSVLQESVRTVRRKNLGRDGKACYS